MLLKIQQQRFIASVLCAESQNNCAILVARQNGHIARGDYRSADECHHGQANQNLPDSYSFSREQFVQRIHFGIIVTHFAMNA